MKSAQQLWEIESLDELDDVRLCELVRHVHIVVGDGGRCLCGTYGGKAMSCSDILKMKSPDFLSAMIQSQMTIDHGGEVFRPTK